MTKPSIIDQISKEKLQEIVFNSKFLSDILKSLNLYVSSGNYRPLKRRLNRDNIDYSHITLGFNANKGKIFPSNPQPLENLLIQNSNHSTTNIKRRLISENIFEEKCVKCGIGPIWAGEKLVLQLDHINGDHNDNRIENLRLLCPNCHSQTKTYGAGNKKIGKAKKYFCQCGNEKSKKAKICNKCATTGKRKNTKIIWPSYEELTKMIEKSNYTQVAKILGVSDNAVRKRINNKT